MKTKTVKLYQFDELPAEARAKVIEKHYDINVDFDWWTDTYEDFQNLAATIGITVDIEKTYFTGFYHQGQGSAFTADIDVLKLIEGIKKQSWKEYAPKEKLSFCPVTKNIARVCKLITDGHIDFSAWIEPTNRETSVKVNFEYSVLPEQLEKAAGDLCELIEDTAETLNKWFFNQLRNESDYRQSEEAIIETIKANEYYFDLSGNIGTPDIEPTLTERLQSLGARIRGMFTAKFFRFTALTLMWCNAVAVLVYSVIQHPVVRQFINR